MHDDLSARIAAEHLTRDADKFPVITYEREVNANGVPVRRLALRGEWEVDPAAVRDWSDANLPIGAVEDVPLPEFTDVVA